MNMLEALNTLVSMIHPVVTCSKGLALVAGRN